MSTFIGLPSSSLTLTGHSHDHFVAALKAPFTFSVSHTGLTMKSYLFINLGGQSSAQKHFIFIFGKCPNEKNCSAHFFIYFFYFSYFIIIIILTKPLFVSCRFLIYELSLLAINILQINIVSLWFSS